MALNYAHSYGDVHEMKRQLLGVGATLVLLLFALIFVPTALGWKRGTVNSYTAGTFYPQTVPTSTSATAPLLSCDLTAGTTVPVASINLSKNGSKASYFSCKNNWGTDVTFSISVVNNGGTTLSLSGASGLVPAGQQKCIPATVTTGNGADGNVRYRVTATASDLSATIEFAGGVIYGGKDDLPCALP